MSVASRRPAARFSGLRVLRAGRARVAGHGATAGTHTGSPAGSRRHRRLHAKKSVARRVVRRVVNVALLVVVTVAMAWFVFIGVGPLSGRYRVITVLSGSMRPHMPVGSLVIDVPEPVSALRVGQVITIQAPTAQHQVVTHRVVQVTPAPGGPLIRTKGDANAAPDAWVAQIPAHTVWHEVKAVPNGGRLVYFFRQPLVHRITVDALPVLLVVGVLVAIWGAGEKKETADEPGVAV